MGEVRKRYDVTVIRTTSEQGMLLVYADNPTQAEEKACRMEGNFILDVGSTKVEVKDVGLGAWRCSCGWWGTADKDHCHICGKPRPKFLRR